jgi:hypothetical protein
VPFISCGRCLKNYSNGSSHHPYKSGSIYDALDKGLNKIGFGKDNLIKICPVIMAAAVLLLASSCTTPANRQPIITSLEAEAEWTVPLGSLQVACTASDPDGDELSYEWTATGGEISGTGAVVNWTAPEEVGMYDITVVVDDGHDGEDTGSLTLIVSNGPPPIIQNLIVTAKEPKYLKETTTGYKVGKTKEYYIECIASDTDGELSELVYEWSCDGGGISRGGSLITWTAPDTACDVTITVKVFDSAGNWVKKSILFEVVSCSSCEFG